MTVSRVQATRGPPARRARSGDATTACTGQVILEAQAAFKRVLRSGWRMCRICLTRSGMTLSQGGRPVLEVPADLIVAARIERVRSVLGRKKDVLCIEYSATDRRRKVSRVWLTGADVHLLQEKLAETTAPLDLAAIESLLPHLDADAERIALFLWERRHATIRELAEHARMPSHMDILLKIREVINPIAEEFFGFPLLVFAQARRDTFTGEDVPYSWWILGAGESGRVQYPEILVDTFDEGNGFSVLACLPCGEADQVNVSFDRGDVQISSGESSGPARVSLPSGLRPEDCRQTFRNGILELRWDGVNVPSPSLAKREK